MTLNNSEKYEEVGLKTASPALSSTYNVQNGNIPKLQELASRNDPAAIELLTLMQARSELELKFKVLEKDTDNLLRKNESYQDDLRKVNNFIIGVVVAVTIAFIVTTITLYWGEILNNKSDKDLYLKYNDVYMNYYDSTSQQQKQIDKLNSDLELLKVKNYLK